jgi:hypothetical protein
MFQHGHASEVLEKILRLIITLYKHWQCALRVEPLKARGLQGFPGAGKGRQENVKALLNTRANAFLYILNLIKPMPIECR